MSAPRNTFSILRFGLAVAAAGVLARNEAQAANAVAREPRGGRVGWARLNTGHSSWRVHDANDPLLADFIRRNTSLNIDARCYPTDPGDLDDLCRYPFIFTNNLTNVGQAQPLSNLREYLKRGGFLYIDRCVNLSFSLPQEPFYEQHLAFFAKFLPEAKVSELPEDHEIFRSFYSLKLANLPIRVHAQAGHNGVYGVFDGGRMVALFSLANFQCGWPQSSDRGAMSMQMIANIYVYVMTRAADAPDKP